MYKVLGVEFMLKKNKVVFRIISLIAVALVIVATSFIIVNQSRPKEIPQHLMTMSRAIENGAYQLVCLDSFKTMEKLMSSNEQLVKLKYISQYERTKFNSTNIIWKMRVKEVLNGTLTVGDEIDVIFPALDTATLPTIGDSNSIIMSLVNSEESDSGEYYSGLIGVIYLKNGRIYPAYDLEDFTKEYVGMKENQFKKKIKQFIE